MAFEFKRKESVCKGVRRLGQRQIEKGLEDLKHCKKLEAVHEVRKTIKQLRALLRLVRSAMAKADYRGNADALREAAGHLSDARDAHVKVNALANLIDHYQHELGPRSFDEMETDSEGRLS